jgi:hypothetical protein
MQSEAATRVYDRGGPGMGCREVMCVHPAMAPAEHVRRAIAYAWRAEFAYAQGVAPANLEMGMTDFGASNGRPAGTVPMRPSPDGTHVDIVLGGYDASSMEQLHHSHPPGFLHSPSSTDLRTSSRNGVPVTTHGPGMSTVNLMWQDSTGTFYQTFIPLNYRAPGGPEF